MQSKLKRARWPLFAVVLALALLGMHLSALAQSDGPYDLTWNTVDGSGATASHGGKFELTGTTGQFDAAGAPYPEMATPPGGHGGGIFRILFGGFWQPLHPGTLDVRTRVAPIDDASSWLIDVSGPTPFTATVPSGGGTGPQMMATGSYTVTERAGEGAFAPNYTPAYTCTVNGQAGPTGEGATLNVDVAVDRNVVCTFTNVRRTRTLTVTKALTPTNDGGRFVMHANGNTGVAAGHGALVTATVYVSATASFSETAGAGSDMTYYATAYACDDPVKSNGIGASASLIMPDADVTCVFTNTRQARTLTVTKALSPTNDDGLFTMYIGDNTGAEAGDGARVSAAVEVSTTIRFSETAGIGSDLGNYTTVYACDYGDLSGVATSGALIMPDVDVTCVFTNTRKTRTLTVIKALSPTKDDGLFALHIDDKTGVEAGQGARVSTAVDVSATVRFSETAGIGSDLGNYTTVYACDYGDLSGVETSGVLIMPDVDVTCVFTNTRKTQVLTVAKALSPISDSGLFVMHVGDNASEEAGDGATITATVDVGVIASISETAGTATSLADYATIFSCDDPLNTQGAATAGILTMPAADVSCIFSNTRRADPGRVIFLPLVAR